MSGNPIQRGDAPDSRTEVVQNQNKGGGCDVRHLKPLRQRDVGWLAGLCDLTVTNATILGWNS